MSYKLRVIDTDDTTFGFTPFFRRFIYESAFLDDSKGIDHYLELYGAKNCFNSPYIEFENEQQAILFVLKWS